MTVGDGPRAVPPIQRIGTKLPQAAAGRSGIAPTGVAGCAGSPGAIRRHGTASVPSPTIHNEDRSWRGLFCKPCKCVRFCDHLQGAAVGRVPWPRRAGGMTARGWMVDPGPGGTDGPGQSREAGRRRHATALRRERKIEGSCPAWVLGWG